ncbi:MAG: bifunctional pyr operon transcriptional regulator/uracil phosphoribosyltransferase PyrR [Chloroflexi bacterium]|nr:bifunctional pyr operon transcriptional regulator/uracil phosphoribosyltransferase PyrR [Chloroflexota bacterium]
MPDKIILQAQDVRRALTRIAHEIVEANRGTEGLLFVGVHSRGVPLAQRLAATIGEFEGVSIPVGALDISLYRDDIAKGAKPVVRRTDIPTDVTDKKVVLIDDVLYTGRSIRAAMDALMDLGRPQCIQLAVLIDRGHRELPIRPDFVGRNLPTSSSEEIAVHLKEIDGRDEVAIVRKEPAAEVRP